MPWSVIWKFLTDPNRKISVISAVTTVLFWVFGAWSFGMLPALGAGFAKAGDVSAIQATLLEASILDHRLRYCSAPYGTDVRIYYFTQTQSKVRAYKETTGADFVLPPCKDLVYVAAANEDASD
jgi:hypothetical protein